MSDVPSSIINAAFDAHSTSSRVDYCVLVHRDAQLGARLPFILHLHGAMSSAASLEAAKPSYDKAWRDGLLPPAIVACASTPTLGGFYIDHPGGPAWEALVSSELPGVIKHQFGPLGRQAAIGFSMGGYGVLKLALREPERYSAVAALCPAIFPAETPTEVPLRNRVSVLGELHKAMGDDEQLYASNSVYGILRRNVDWIRRANLALFLDCGAEDEFALQDGAQYFHKILNRLEVPHIFHLVPGAGHADTAVVQRQTEAIRFIGRKLREG